MATYGAYNRDSNNLSQSDEMLHIQGDLKSGFVMPKGGPHRISDKNGDRHERMERNEPRQGNPAGSRYRKSMVFSIELNEDEEVAD